ncbi:MAG: pilus assembly protein PilX [Candidatus Competibacteraceae bacterium]|nr:pilus assembly protein PilX [Candidatus Competibacteraceae bacterium]
MFNFKCFQATARSLTGWNQQQGSALIIALVFLLAMTLIGTTAMQGTSQQERMAGNFWDHNLAFQGAEGALSVARGIVDGTPPTSNPVQPSAQNLTWWNANATAITGYTDLATQPRYVIQNLGAAGTSSGSATFGAVTFPKCRVTARADGGTTSAVVILEEVVECAL